MGGALEVDTESTNSPAVAVFSILNARAALSLTHEMAIYTGSKTFNVVFGHLLLNASGAPVAPGSSGFKNSLMAAQCTLSVRKYRARVALLLLALDGCGGGDPLDCRFKPGGAPDLEQAQWVEMCVRRPPTGGTGAQYAASDRATGRSATRHPDRHAR